MKSHVNVMVIDADVNIKCNHMLLSWEQMQMLLLTSNEQVLIWGEGRQGTDADVTVVGTVASINTMGTTEVEVLGIDFILIGWFMQGC